MSRSDHAIMEIVPGIPRNEDGPVFQEPWEAQVFAMAVHLHEKGAFTWSEWADLFSKELAINEKNDASNYYLCWLKTLETILCETKLLSSQQILNRKIEWKNAVNRTPHGEAIEL